MNIAVEELIRAFLGRIRAMRGSAEAVPGLARP